MKSKFLLALLFVFAISCVDGEVNSGAVYFSSADDGMGVIKKLPAAVKNGYSEITFTMNNPMGTETAVGVLTRAKHENHYISCYVLRISNSIFYEIRHVHPTEGTLSDSYEVVVNDQVAADAMFVGNTNTLGCEVTDTAVNFYLNRVLQNNVTLTLGEGGSVVNPVENGSVGFFGNDSTDDIRVTNFAYFVEKPDPCLASTGCMAR